MNPTIGRIVHYTLGQSDAEQINRRRTSEHAIREDIEDGTWPKGAQAHIGNEARVGQVLPAIVVAVWSPRCVNLQLFLDGNDTLWLTSREVSDSGEPQDFRWHWPEQVAKASAATTAAASAMASAGEADTNEA